MENRENMIHNVSEWNLWHSIDFLLLLQRISCVSPFYLDRSRNKLMVSAFTRFYLWTVLIGFLFGLYILFFRWNCFGIILTFLPAGYLWTILTGYEILSTNAHFILNVILVDAGKWKQMEFLHKVDRIDQRLAYEFRMCVNFRQYRRQIVSFTILFILYYYGVTICVCYWAHLYGNYKLLMFLLAYQFVQISLASVTFAATNSAFLIRDRFRLLAQIYQRIERDLRENDATIDKQIMLHKIQMIFRVFKELCDLIRLLGEYGGWTHVIWLVQDFTLPLIRWYFTFYILWDEGIEGNGAYVGVVLIWFVGNLARSAFSAVGINKTLTQVN